MEVQEFFYKWFKEKGIYLPEEMVNDFDSVLKHQLKQIKEDKDLLETSLKIEENKNEFLLSQLKKERAKIEKAKLKTDYKTIFKIEFTEFKIFDCTYSRLRPAKFKVEFLAWDYFTVMIWKVWFHYQVLPF